MTEQPQTPAARALLEPIGFGAAKLPPGYAVIRSDDHTMWVRLTPDGLDWTEEGCIHWDRWASFRGAWAHYRAEVTP